MIRIGIHSISQLNPTNLKDVFGKEKNISIYLYSQISKIGNPEKKVQYEELILNRFNSDRNVIKRTYKNRFNTFDDKSITIIAEQNFAENSLLDLAISDGRASCYFLKNAVSLLQKFSYTGTDIQLNYLLNKKKPDSISYVITDAKNRIIEITIPPFVWNYARTEGRLYFINNLLKYIYLKYAESSLSNGNLKCREMIDLIHSDYKSILSKCSSFNTYNYDLFDEIPLKYKVIRAMNILHYGYFKKDKLVLILNNIFNGLALHGLFIEGSNEKEGSPVDGSIYKKTAEGFILLNQPENPSRIKDLVLSFVPKNLDA